MWQEIEEIVRSSGPKPPVPADKSLPLEMYAGRYSNDIYGSMNIAEEDGGLVAEMGPRKLRAIFSHWNRDSFLANIPGFMNKTSIASFAIGPVGMAESVRMLLFIEGEHGRSALFKREQA